MAITRNNKSDTITHAEIGRRLGIARESGGITQQQAADALGIPRAAVIQMEAGNRNSISDFRRRHDSALAA